MKTHGYPSGGELLAFLLMLGGALFTVVLAVVALGVMLTDRSATGWWWASGASAAITIAAWLYL